MRRTSMVWAMGMVLLLGVPVQAADAPPHAIEFPPGWTVEAVDETIAGGQARVIREAFPDDRTEHCRVVDLTAVGMALAGLGVTEADALDRAAADLLGHGETASKVSGLGYSDPWSMYVEGEHLDDQTRFGMYSFLGRDAWPGLDDAWLAVECSSDARFHQDWRMIARTFAYDMPDALRRSTGPLAFGGRIELPTVDLALAVPDDWMAADVADPEIHAALTRGGSDGEWFALQLKHGVGDEIERKASDGDHVMMWAWAPRDQGSWPEHCELVVEEPFWDSAEQLAEMAQARIDEDEKLRDSHAWSVIDVPAGSMARFDYDWSASSGGSDFHLVAPELHVVLTCQDYSIEDRADAAAKRQRWLAIATSIEPLP